MKIFNEEAIENKEKITETFTYDQARYNIFRTVNSKILNLIENRTMIWKIR